MKASSQSGKSKPGDITRQTKKSPMHGDLFLGYKALHELRILVRLASAQNPLDSKIEKPSY